MVKKAVKHVIKVRAKHCNWFKTYTLHYVWKGLASV